mgnify:CR=1 FL=1
MPKHKSTTVFSELSKFFKENDATRAMNTIMDMTGTLRMSEKRLFHSESKSNSKVTQRQVLELLLLFPCFMVKNAYRYAGSAMESIVRCGKDVFYRFLANEATDWRKILYSSATRLWPKIRREGAGSASGTVCLMVDDTEFPKRGVHTEAIGKVFSHVTHRMILGFKGLFLGITDGKSQLLIDFALVGEKGKKGDHGLKKEQLEARLSKDRRKGCATEARLKEYDQSKIALAIEMTALRFSDYETIGGLFRDAVQGSTELSVTDRIWDAILEIVYAMSKCFDLPDDEILNIILDKSTSLNNVMNIYTLKYAC